MPLRLTSLVEGNLPLEVEGLTPDALAGKSLAEVERLPVWHGRREAPLGEFFRAAGDTREGRLWCEGDWRSVHGLAAGMRSGHVVAEGDVGRMAACGMRGGLVSIRGHAGDGLGAEMRGGEVRVLGSAGHGVGGALPGSERGMRGGTILVHGQAGSQAGMRMRRGMLAIGGDCGELPGFQMRAGSLFLFGCCGDHPGCDMRRGTIACFGRAPQLLPGFRAAGVHRLLILRLLLRDLRERGLPAASSAGEEIALYHGDLLQGGRGEIWLSPR